jgi:hypothetical protein
VCNNQTEKRVTTTNDNAALMEKNTMERMKNFSLEKVEEEEDDDDRELNHEFGYKNSINLYNNNIVKKENNNLEFQPSISSFTETDDYDNNYNDEINYNQIDQLNFDPITIKTDYTYEVNNQISPR